MTSKPPRKPSRVRAEPLVGDGNAGGTDLQYITQRVTGALFGGWYRVLDGKHLELLALGSVWQAPRNSALPQRQARAMLAKLARLRRRTVASRIALPLPDSG